MTTPPSPPAAPSFRTGTLLQAAGRVWGRVREFAATRDLDWCTLRGHLRGYRKEDLKKDVRAGGNVAMLDFPQGMAYALIAGLPPQVGVYGSAMASLVAPLFSSSRFVITGPTNATAVLVLSAFLAIPVVGVSERVAMLGVLVLLVGLFLVFAAVFKVANLIQYVSSSVSTGYITAAALLIIANQAHTLLGYQLDSATTFFDVLGMTVSGLGGIHVPSLMVSLFTAVFLVLFKRHLGAFPTVALALVSVSVLSLVLSLLNPALSVACLQAVPMGVVPLAWPSLSWGAVSQLASTALAIAILATLEGVSIGKSLAARTGDRLDVNQQVFGLGMANLACAFSTAMPASGSLTRSQLNFSSGARSPVSSLVSGVMLAVGILVGGPLLQFVPQPALATVVVFVGISLINRRNIRVSLNSTRSDAIVFASTLAAGLLFPLDFAVYFGVFVSIVLFLRKVSTPELVEYSFNEEGQLAALKEKESRPTPAISIIHVEGELFFGAADIFRDEIRRVCSDERLKVVILRMKNAHHLDATSVLALEELVRYLAESGRHLIISGAMKDVYRVFKNSGLIDRVGRENFFPGSPQNPNAATRNALRRAKALLGDTKADIRIFYDPNKVVTKEEPVWEGPMI